MLHGWLIAVLQMLQAVEIGNLAQKELLDF
jgi:hypothetical protein